MQLFVYTTYANIQSKSIRLLLNKTEVFSKNNWDHLIIFANEATRAKRHSTQNCHHYEHTITIMNITTAIKTETSPHSAESSLNSKTILTVHFERNLFTANHTLHGLYRATFCLLSKHPQLLFKQEISTSQNSQWNNFDQIQWYYTEWWLIIIIIYCSWVITIQMCIGYLCKMVLLQLLQTPTYSNNITSAFLKQFKQKPATKNERRSCAAVIKLKDLLIWCHLALSSINNLFKNCVM